MRINRISTKLAATYAALFAIMLFAVTAVINTVITDRARSVVSEQIISSSKVFTHLFVERGRDTQLDTKLQIRDFGFRSAVTSEDKPTIVSALETLKERLKVDGLAYVDLEGNVVAATGSPLPLSGLTEQIAESIFDESGHDPGIAFRSDQPMLAGYEVIFAPNIVGFIVYGEQISQNDIKDIIDLSSVPLEISIVQKEFVQGNHGTIFESNGFLKFTTDVPSLIDDSPVSLTLSYPLEVAYAPVRTLVATLILIAIAGVVIVSVASWFIAKHLASPVSQMAKAADQIRHGATAQVSIKTGDEIEELATAFNHMSSEVEAREQELKRRARLDMDTELPNRLAILEELDALNPNAGNSFIMAIGINRFSEIRGGLGFEASAELLQQFYCRLIDHPSTHFAARISGDTFAVIVTYTADECISEITSSYLNVMNSSFQVQDSAIDVLVSIGTCVEETSLGANELKRAMIALDQARSSRADWKEYDHNQYLRTSKTLSLMGELVRGIERDHLHVEYQPKFDLRSRAPIGVEALVRWHDPDRGKVFPDQFIPLAEETGHIEPLTEFVLSQSIHDQRLMQQAGLPLAMSVNISGRLVGNARFSDLAFQLVSKASGKICFEITETAVMDEPEAGIAILNKFNDAGIEISIDDYGSGLSSLAYLKQLPAAELKIDRAFISQLDNSAKDAMLVRSTINLAHSLGMTVTAEGIENEITAALLASFGCDIGQGYYLGRPMKLEQLIEFLKPGVQGESKTDSPENEHRNAV